jgi:hypothetical protein
MRGMRDSCIYMERPEVLGALARLCDVARERMGTSVLDDERLLGFFFSFFLIFFLFYVLMLLTEVKHAIALTKPRAQGV